MFINCSLMYPSGKMLPKKGRISLLKYLTPVIALLHFSVVMCSSVNPLNVAASRHPYPIETVCFVRRIVSQIFLYCEWVPCVRGEAQLVSAYQRPACCWYAASGDGCSQQTAWAFGLPADLISASIAAPRSESQPCCLGNPAGLMPGKTQTLPWPFSPYIPSCKTTCSTSTQRLNYTTYTCSQLFY